MKVIQCVDVCVDMGVGVEVSVCVMRSPKLLVRVNMVRMVGLFIDVSVVVAGGGLKLEMNCLYVVEMRQYGRKMVSGKDVWDEGCSGG